MPIPTLPLSVEKATPFAGTSTLIPVPFDAIIESFYFFLFVPIPTIPFKVLKAVPPSATFTSIPTPL